MKSVALLLVLLFAGCSAAPAPVRLTRETVLAGHVTVEWPKGIKVGDVVTFESRVEKGAVLSVAPLPFAAP